jgi:hypothetical protein
MGRFLSQTHKPAKSEARQREWYAQLARRERALAV